MSDNSSLDLHATVVDDEDVDQDMEFSAFSDEITEAVGELLHYKEHYFEIHPISEACEKNSRVKHKLDDILLLIEKYSVLSNIRCHKAKYFYNHGRALNIIDSYSPEAQDLLSRSLKLNARNVDAWKTLADVYWKKKELLDAAVCFHRANSIENNRVSLRNLSILMRQISAEDYIKFMVSTYNITPENPNVEKFEKGLEFAQEAVNLDATDGTSWGVLANAYLGEYFMNGQNAVILKKCLSAYNQAYKDSVAQNCPAINFNHSNALRYAEEYAEALVKLDKAIILETTWQQPRESYDKFLKYLDNLQELYTCKGRVKPRKLQQQLKNLTPDMFGPNNPSSQHKLKHKLISELEEGPNDSVVVLGTVIGEIVGDDTSSIPLVFGVTDASGAVVLISLYNLKKGKNIPNSASVCFTHPNVETKKFSHKDKNYFFKSIRIEQPVMLVVNGRRMPQQTLSYTFLCSETDLWDKAPEEESKRKSRNKDNDQKGISRTNRKKS